MTKRTKKRHRGQKKETRSLKRLLQLSIKILLKQLMKRMQPRQKMAPLKSRRVLTRRLKKNTSHLATFGPQAIK